MKKVWIVFSIILFTFCQNPAEENINEYGVLRIECWYSIDVIHVEIDGEYIGQDLQSSQISPNIFPDVYEKAVDIGEHTVSGYRVSNPIQAFSKQIFVPEQGITFFIRNIL